MHYVNRFFGKLPATTPGLKTETMDLAYLKEREKFLSDTTADIDKGLYDDALALADARLKLFSGDMDAYLVRASCQARMGKPAEAEEILERWHDIVRDQSQVYEVVGDAYNREGMVEEAIQSYMKCAALNPHAPVARRVSEKMASLQGGAIEEKEEDTPVDISADFHTITLARLYVKQGHFKMAGDVLDRILERDPDNVEAREYAGHVKQLMEEGWGPVIDELNRWLNTLQQRKTP